MYDSINDLPIVCQLNLPPPALRVYREAFNEAWLKAPEGKSRYRIAQHSAWITVRTRFRRDPQTGCWTARARERQPSSRQAPIEAAALATIG